MKLVIDNRENKLIEHFKNREHVEIRMLEIGDIIFYHEDKIVLLIERKTITDLSSSIKDGRYREQKKRLLCCGIPVDKVLYLLEGDVNNTYSGRVKTKTIIGSIINSIIRDNIKVYRTNNIIDTKIFIECIYEKLLKDPSKLIDNSICNISYESTLKISKKDNLTPEVCNVIQMAQIPGISFKIARTIIDEYGSLYNLCLKYKNMEEEVCELLLSNLKYKTRTGKCIRIGDKRSKTIYKFIKN